jgi:hypothetical protein
VKTRQSPGRLASEKNREFTLKKMALSLIASVTLGLCASAFAQNPFGDFNKALKDLKKGMKNDSAAVAPTPALAPTAAQPAAAQKSSHASFGAKATEAYCKRLFSVAAINKKGPINEALVSEEFNVEPKDFYDAMVAALDTKPGFTSYTFPSPDFYQGEFETDKVDVLYDMLLSYPSPKYAAALIAESRATSNQPQYDHQAKIDATVALAILHFRMQDKSKSPNRWKDLLTSVQNEEHYTAQVVRARLLKSGEMGTTDVSQSIALAVGANSLRSKYSTEGGYRTMSSNNYQVTSNRTLFETLMANPNHPSRRQMNQFVLKYDAMSKSLDPAPELKVKLGPGLAAIEKAAKSASDKAEMILSGAKDAGNVKAQKASLDSATRNRVSDASEVNADSRALATLARQMEQVDKLDENQKKLFAEALKDAHETGDRAVAMMGTMVGALMDLLMQRGIEAMPAILPYSKKFQTYSDNACTVITRLDRAAMVTGTPAEPDRSTMASMMAVQ